MGNRNSSSQSQTRKPLRKRRTGGFQRRAYWMWKSADPSSTWTHFSDIENEIIEDAFAAGQSQVILNNEHIIDLKKLSQTSRVDPNSKSQQIKRDTDVETYEEKEYIREERFHLPESKLKVATMSEDNFETNSPMITNWTERHKVRYDIYDLVNSDDLHRKEGPAFFKRIIEMAAKGIIQHGEGLGKKEEAEWIANQLLQALSKYEQAQKMDIIEDCCISLYTRESFLYKSINKMLREGDSNQVDALGPFCYLLNGFVDAHTYMIGGWPGATFRGVNLTPEMLQEYKNANEKKLVFTWPGLTSTSRCREKAEVFGNTLFEFTDAMGVPVYHEKVSRTAKKGLMIEHKSVFPTEQEVLFPANSRFVIHKIEENPTTGKNIIYLNRIHRF